jgi:hypothetical protein
VRVTREPRQHGPRRASPLKGRWQLRPPDVVDGEDHSPQRTRRLNSANAIPPSQRTGQACRTDGSTLSRSARCRRWCSDRTRPPGRGVSIQLSCAFVVYGVELTGRTADNQGEHEMTSRPAPGSD